MTNRKGNSPTTTIHLTHNDDLGLRTLSGGQYSIQVGGIPGGGWVGRAAAGGRGGARGARIYAVLGTAADAEVRGRGSGRRRARTARLTFLPGATVSDATDGSALPPLTARSKVTTRGAVGRAVAAGRGPDGDRSTVMPEQLTKLRPDRDLQCYFQQPSAVAALSEATANGFRVSGSWRQQFDWAVVEWSRDNVFEHPALRNLPDGDLSGLRLSYEETRTNCIAMDSTTYDPIGWSCVRIWEESGGAEHFHKVALRAHATAVEGRDDAGDGGVRTAGGTDCGRLRRTRLARSARELARDGVGHAREHRRRAGDIRQREAGRDGGRGRSAVAPDLHGGAGRERESGRRLWRSPRRGNGELVSVLGDVFGRGVAGAVEGRSGFRAPDGHRRPARHDDERQAGAVDMGGGLAVPGFRAQRIRSRDLELAGDAERIPGIGWRVPGAGGSRMTAAEVVYTGAWTEERGNYSGGSIRHTQTSGAQAALRVLGGGGASLISGHAVHAIMARRLRSRSTAARRSSLKLKRGSGRRADPRAARSSSLPASQHTVTVTHRDRPATTCTSIFSRSRCRRRSCRYSTATPMTTLATDWDTDHSLAIAPERTAWLIDTLGFKGARITMQARCGFTSSAIRTAGTRRRRFSSPGRRSSAGKTEITIAGVTISHLNLITRYGGEHREVFRAADHGRVVGGLGAGGRRHADDHGASSGGAGNAIAIAVVDGQCGIHGDDESGTLAGGADGDWLTDLTATPRLNRAARDWTRSYIARAQGVRDRSDGGVQHGTAERGRSAGGGDCATVSGSRVLSDYAGAADRISDRRARHFGSRFIAIWRM